MASLFLIWRGSRSSLRLLVLLGLLCGLGASVARPEARLAADIVRPGMTPDEVKGLLGPPKRMCRQILFHRHIELWTYEQPTPILVELHYQRGMLPQVVAVHSLAAKPAP